MPEPLSLIRGRVTRLRVFSFAKRYMDLLGECPTAPEVAAALDIGLRSAQYHLSALDGAAGLPLPTRGTARYRAALERRKERSERTADVVELFEGRRA